MPERDYFLYGSLPPPVRQSVHVVLAVTNLRLLGWLRLEDFGSLVSFNDELADQPPRCP